MSEVDKLLSDGLTSGYAGKAERQATQHGPFKFESSQFQTPEGDIYLDDWLANRTGGGQEIAKSGENTSTRLYGGGTIRLEELSELGLTKKDVTGYLKKKISEQGPKTRLFKDCEPESDGDWQYKYKINSVMSEIPLTVGMETISFQGKMVFAHAFILTTVE